MVSAARDPVDSADLFFVCLFCSAFGLTRVPQFGNCPILWAALRQESEGLCLTSSGNRILGSYAVEARIMVCLLHAAGAWCAWGLNCSPWRSRSPQIGAPGMYPGLTGMYPAALLMYPGPHGLMDE